MAYIKWFLIISFWVLIAAFFHYTLPQRDIVRIVNTYEERQDLDDWTRIFWSVPDSQSETLINRDVQFIQTVRANGRPMVYRNEDTGWRWPPYFKFDTANLYTEANDAISTKADPQWFLLTHYGWRNEFLSIFPNAISIRPVAGPAVSKPIPWVTIIVLVLFVAVIWAIWVRLRRFKRSRLDPALEDMGDRVYSGRSRVRRWFRGDGSP